LSEDLHMYENTDTVQCESIHNGQTQAIYRYNYFWSDLTWCTMNLCLHFQSVFRKSQSLSGRTLRKLPFIAHAIFIQVHFNR